MGRPGSGVPGSPNLGRRRIETTTRSAAEAPRILASAESGAGPKRNAGLADPRLVPEGTDSNSGVVTMAGALAACGAVPNRSSCHNVHSSGVARSAKTLSVQPDPPEPTRGCLCDPRGDNLLVEVLRHHLQDCLPVHRKPNSIFPNARCLRRRRDARCRT